jgi:hypothetical protein
MKNDDEGYYARRSQDHCSLRGSQVTDQGAIAANLERFYQAIVAHDRESPSHLARGVGITGGDMQSLGFEEGEELWPGIRIHVDDGPPGGFRVLCSGEHSTEGPAERELIVYWDGSLADE